MRSLSDAAEQGTIKFNRSAHTAACVNIASRECIGILTLISYRRREDRYKDEYENLKINENLTYEREREREREGGGGPRVALSDS